MRCLLIGAALLLNLSCATLSNRRDLYRPINEYDVAAPSTTATTTTTTTKASVPPPPPSRLHPTGPITPEEEPVLPPP